jgi:hypothetical protein
MKFPHIYMRGQNHWNQIDWNLKKLAAYYLAIPADSVISKQIFSETGGIVTSRRTSLSETIFFLRKNWMILEK